MEAYSLVKRPALLFNAARAYEEAGLYAKAVALFKAYQGLADAPADGKADAAARIQRLEAVIAERKAAEEAKAAEAQRQAQADEARKQAQQREAEAARQAQQDQQAKQAQQAQQARDAQRAQQVRDAQEAERRAQQQGGRAPSLVKPAAPAEAPLPWVAIASTSVAAVGGAVLYGLALAEQAAADDLEPHLKTQADKQTYLDHAANYDKFRYSAIGVGIVAAGLGAWAGYELYQRSASPAKASAAGWQLQVLPTGLAVAF